MTNPFKKKTKKVRFSSKFKGSNITDSKTGSAEEKCNCECSSCIDCMNKNKE